MAAGYGLLGLGRAFQEIGKTAQGYYQQKDVDKKLKEEQEIQAKRDRDRNNLMATELMLREGGLLADQARDAATVADRDRRFKLEEEQHVAGRQKDLREITGNLGAGSALPKSLQQDASKYGILDQIGEEAFQPAPGAAPQAPHGLPLEMLLLQSKEMRSPQEIQKEADAKRLMDSELDYRKKSGDAALMHGRAATINANKTPASMPRAGDRELELMQALQRELGQANTVAAANRERVARQVATSAVGGMLDMTTPQAQMQVDQLYKAQFGDDLQRIADLQRDIDTLRGGLMLGPITTPPPVTAQEQAVGQALGGGFQLPPGQFQKPPQQPGGGVADFLRTLPRSGNSPAPGPAPVQRRRSLGGS